MAAKNATGKSPIFCENNAFDERIAELLLRNGADFSDRSNDGSTPLLVAAELGNVDSLKYLINLGADVNATNNHGKTALDAVLFSSVIPLKKKKCCSVLLESSNTFDLNPKIREKLKQLQIEIKEANADA